MKVSTDSNHFYATRAAQPSTAAGTDRASFSAALTAATVETSTVKQADFTSMTRKEMFDWMNEQTGSGKMSLDESSAFLGMTIKISAATGQPVDMATDTTRIDFIEKTRLGIEGARSNNDPDLVKRLQAAMEVMRRQQGQALGVDTRA